MKAALFAFLALCAVVQARALDVAREADVIAQCETGTGWNGIPGRHGELGDHQFILAAWREEMPGIDFAQAKDPAVSRLAAIKRIRRIVAALERHGYKATPARVATAWNIGIDGILRRRGRPTAYGNRAANLYYAP